MILPGWNSLSTVIRAHRFFEVAGIVALFLLVVCEVCAYVYGHRKDELLTSIQMPRSLTATQRVQIRDALLPFAGTRISIGRLADAEALNFSGQIIAVLRDAQWNVSFGTPRIGEANYGVECLTSDPSQPAAQALVSALRNAEIPVAIKAWKQDSFLMMVGLKPVVDAQ